MPVYIEIFLHLFCHSNPSNPERQPYLHEISQYGAKVQYEDNSADLNALENSGITEVVKISGELIFYE